MYTLEKVTNKHTIWYNVKEMDPARLRTTLTDFIEEVCFGINLVMSAHYFSLTLKHKISLAFIFADTYEDVHME